MHHISATNSGPPTHHVVDDAEVEGQHELLRRTIIAKPRVSSILRTLLSTRPRSLPGWLGRFEMVGYLLVCLLWLASLVGLVGLPASHELDNNCCESPKGFKNGLIMWKMEMASLLFWGESNLAYEATISKTVLVYKGVRSADDSAGLVKLICLRIMHPWRGPSCFGNELVLITFIDLQ